jgi:cytochrome c oxidase subunit 2
MKGMMNLLAQVPTPTSLPAIAPRSGSFWMPPQASTGAAHTDAVFQFIFWISVFFFILIVGLMLLFVIRYRQRVEGEGPRVHLTHNTPLELTWTAIPLVLVVVMFYMGFRGYMDMMNPPVNALDIHVLGQKWFWSFTYPNGHVDSELHVPIDQPVRLVLSSNDVIHSFYIPAFRIKRDAVPGRYNSIWFEAKQPGEYLALCAEYCGTKHSDMLARLVVHEPGMYEKWLDEASNPFKTRSLSEVGALLVQKRCASCHSVTGAASVGPTLKGLFGHPAATDKGTVTVDEDYLRESILYPQAKIVQGFQPVMPTFRGQLKDQEILAIIEYIRELSK